MKNFKKLQVWSKGFKIVLNVYKVTNKLPDRERFGLISQMNRAAVSIPSNIAEGSTRSGQKDYKRFLEIALGSSFELETQLLIVKELKFSDLKLIEDLLLLVEEEQKMLTSLIAVIKKASS